MDISFIDRLFALEAESLRKYRLEDSTEHDALMDELERMLPDVTLRLMLGRRRGPLDEMERMMFSFNLPVHERVIFKRSYYSADERISYVAVYATMKNPTADVRPLSDLLWFKAVDHVVVELVGHANIDTREEGPYRKWHFMGGYDPMAKPEIELLKEELTGEVPSDEWGRLLLGRIDGEK